MKKFLFLYIFLIPVITNAQIITTISGNGIALNTGNGGLAINAPLLAPISNAFDKDGNMYVACNGGNVVRKISAAGIITIVAGDSTGFPGFSGDGGLAVHAKLNGPCAIAVDTIGNFYFCELGNNRVRKVSVATGIITTIAGDSIAGYSGDSGLAVHAKLNAPEGICIDIHGNIYVCDYWNARIRKIDTSGIITTIAGKNGFGYSGDGGLADTSAIYYPSSICSDKFGNLYFVEDADGKVRKIDTMGILHTIAGNGIAGYSGNGGLATIASIDPLEVTCDKFGDIYISEHGSRVRIIDTSDIINLIAGTGISGFSGDGGLADTAELYVPAGAAVDTCGNLYICDWGNHRIRKVVFNAACWPESTQNVVTSNSINIYPNPTNGELNIISESKIGNVIIHNLLGQIIFRQDYNTEKLQINVSTLHTGIYFLQLTKPSTGEIITRKFVKE